MAQVASHGKLLLQRLHQQREMDVLCDITIKVKDTEFRAHRNILACFSKYFNSLATKGQDVASLDPEKVSRYALEKLLEFVYTGQMNLSSTRHSAVRRAAVFLGMPDAIKNFPDISESSDPTESSQSDADKEPGAASPMSPHEHQSEDIPNSPLSLSISSVTGNWAMDEEGAEPEEGEEDLDKLIDDDVEYTPGKKRARKPKTFFGCEDGETADLGEEATTTAVRGRGRGRGRGRPPTVKSEDAFVDEADKDAQDIWDTSADWSPSQDDFDEAPPKRAKYGGRRGRGRRGRGRGRGKKRRFDVLLEEDGEEGGEIGEDGREYGEQDPSEANEQSLSCTECNKVFKDQSSLRRHEKIHKGLKPFACIFCSKTFRQATQLKTHLRIHTGEKPFACSSCDKCFAQKCQLVAHRRMHHGEEKPYTCERCGFKFATSSNYKIHIRLHTGEKPYVCDICGQAFAQSSTLTYHKRRHTGEKPYQCDLCGMSFSVSSSLIAHARKHTGETPYKCAQPQCESKFVTSSELKKHMRRLHPDGNNGVQCLLCGNRFASVKNMIKHQEKAHADEVRQHKERARAVVLLASSHPVAFVQSKLSQDQKSLVFTEPSNPEPTTPGAKTDIAMETEDNTTTHIAMVTDTATHTAAGISMDPGTTTVTMDTSTAAALLQDFKAEPTHAPITSEEGGQEVSFEAGAEQTITSDTLHALVEQLRPTSPASNLEQIVIIQTVDNAEQGQTPRST
ncbi:myoneurin [Periophthalmus magnuspinnatus]|uniref:myoneurin n=1 Tax=Periophthalmus magnuspinnatus TaxID=409849 RepID=UPI00145AE687|nr:myoneurin [Periophthalmus magnuspinnatus]